MDLQVSYAHPYCTVLVSQISEFNVNLQAIFISGHPAIPMFGELISGPGAGEVTILIKTVASGVEDPSQVFWFVITPYTDTTEGETVPHLIPNYQSGTFAMIIMSGLDQGERYKFNATAANTFGASGVVTSNSVTAGIGTTKYSCCD